MNISFHEVKKLPVAIIDDFFDENEYVLEELPPVQQRQKKYVLRRYNQYNR